MRQQGEVQCRQPYPDYAIIFYSHDTKIESPMLNIPILISNLIKKQSRILVAAAGLFTTGCDGVGSIDDTCIFPAANGSRVRSVSEIVPCG
jgi:hypothetical protein